MLDASVLVVYLAGGELAEKTRDALFADPGDAWAPHLVDAEVGHALRQTVLAGELSAVDARSALDDLADLPIRPAGHRGILGRAWSCAPT